MGSALQANRFARENMREEIYDREEREKSEKTDNIEERGMRETR